MTTWTISLDDCRDQLNLTAIVQTLTREGYEEGAVRRTIANIRVDNGRGVTMAELLVWSRRQLDLESRSSIVRRR